MIAGHLKPTSKSPLEVRKHPSEPLGPHRHVRPIRGRDARVCKFPAQSLSWAAAGIQLKCDGQDAHGHMPRSHGGAVVAVGAARNAGQASRVKEPLGQHGGTASKEKISSSAYFAGQGKEMQVGSSCS